jgi:hypothetical protein
MHRVILHGPDDPILFRMLVAVADFANTAGERACVGRRVLAERTRVSTRSLGRLVDQAVKDGWLVVEIAGGPRRRAVYNLGPALFPRPDLRSVRAAAFQFERESATYLDHSERQNAPRTVNGFGRSVRPRRSAVAERANAGENWPPPVPLDPPPNRYRGLPDWTAERLDREDP